MLSAFFRNRAGNVTVFFALSAIPLFGIVSAGVEYSRAMTAKAELQNWLDAAVLAGISVSARDKLVNDIKPEAHALKVFKGNAGSTPIKSVDFKLIKSDKLRGTATISQKFLFNVVPGYTEFTIDATSTAALSEVRLPVCFMAMHPSRTHTLELNDSVSVMAPDCHIYGNSTSVDDVVDPHTTANFLTAKTVQAVGFGHHHLENVKPPLVHAPEVLDDPLRLRAYPTAPSGCTKTGYAVSTANTTLSPGRYCNGLTISANNVKLEPGTYFITDGTFKISGGSVTGDGVTIVITGTSKPIDWSGGRIVLTAPKTGKEAGFAIMAERVSNTSSINGTFVDIYGSVYLPKTAFTWKNAGTEVPKGQWTSWIVDGISWTGSGTVHFNFNLANTNIPMPSELTAVLPDVTPGKMVRLLR